jgi:transcription-repair coupling factor (superfamily II helicase)
LAELYQLRGRVGRYKHRAFAYLLIPGERALTEEAQRRLKALEEFSTLGSGFRIAMRDLEIRGCGDILGAEQHGHIAAVGIDTYEQLVQEAVAEIRGKPVHRRALPLFDVAVDAYIPESYVSSEAQKITLYRRIAALQTIEEVDEMRAELEDRFGFPPSPVRRLLHVMRVRAMAADLGVRRIIGAKDTIRLELESPSVISRKTRDTLAQAFGKRIAFVWQQPPSLTFSADGEADPIESGEKLIKALLDAQ